MYQECRCDLDTSNLSRSLVPSLLEQVHLLLMNFSEGPRISICGMFHLEGEVSKRLEDIIDRSPWKLPDLSRPSVVSARELYVLLKGCPNESSSAIQTFSVLNTLETISIPTTWSKSISKEGDVILRIFLAKFDGLGTLVWRLVNRMPWPWKCSTQLERCSI